MVKGIKGNGKISETLGCYNIRECVQLLKKLDCMPGKL